MNSEAMLSKLNEIKEHGNVSPIAAQSLDDLILSVKQDIAIKTAKSTLNQSRYKAALAFAKYCANNHDSRPALAGAFPMSDGRQGICDGFRGVIYDTPMDGLPTIKPEEYDNILKLDQIFPQPTTKLFPIDLPSVNELQTTYKIAKAEYTGKSSLFEHDTMVTGVNRTEWYFNTVYLIDILKCVEPTEAYTMGESPSSLLYLVGNGARGVLCPKRK